MALHNLTTPVFAVAAVAAVVAAVVVANLGGLAPTAQNTRCVCGKNSSGKLFPFHLSSAPFLPRASPP